MRSANERPVMSFSLQPRPTQSLPEEHLLSLSQHTSIAGSGGRAVVVADEVGAVSAGAGGGNVGTTVTAVTRDVEPGGTTGDRNMNHPAAASAIMPTAAIATTSVRERLSSGRADAGVSPAFLSTSAASFAGVGVRPVTTSGSI